MKRLFRVPYTFSNGLHVSAGTYVCLPVYAIENDASIIPNPTEFDGRRHYRLATSAATNANRVSKGSIGVDDFRFSTPSHTALSFGYGRAACPGRHFASLVIKMIFVKLLAEYEFQFRPERGPDGKDRLGSRPSNYMVHEFLFPWPWDWMQLRRRAGGVCPF
jgi:ent-kaurene oxidase